MSDPHTQDAGSEFRKRGLMAVIGTGADASIVSTRAAIGVLHAHGGETGCRVSGGYAQTECLAYSYEHDSLHHDVNVVVYVYSIR